MFNFKWNEKTRFTESQIIKEHENGRNAQELCRELGITTAAFYKWRQHYSGLEVKELRKDEGTGRGELPPQAHVR